MFSDDELELLSHLLNSTYVDDLLENSVDRRVLNTILEKIDEALNG